MRVSFASVAALLKIQGSAYGVGFAVEADTPELLTEARLRMPPGWRPRRPRPPKRAYTLRHATDGVRVEAEGTTLGRGLSHRGALDVLESDLQLFVAQHSRAFVFVHAGVVGVHGRALLFPGTSGSGKTTLVRALLRAGATYYSDEYALLDKKGHVHPYPRALSVRTQGDGKVRVPVTRGWARIGTRSLPLGLVVQTEFYKGGRWRPEPLSKGELALVLLANTVPARERPAEVMATLARAVSRADGFRTRRGTADAAAKAALQLADQHPCGGRLKTDGNRARIRPSSPSRRSGYPGTRW